MPARNNILEWIDDLFSWYIINNLIFYNVRNVCMFVSCGMQMTILLAGCEKQKALAGTESNKGKAGKKKKAKVNGLQSEKTKLTKKRKHASLENDENRTLCNGQLDTEVGQTRPKKQKNNMVATQKHTKSSKSQRKNCDVSKTKTENISMHILQRSVGKQLTEPSPFKHTRKDLHRKKLAEDQPRASQQEGTNVSSEKSKKNKKMKKLSGVSASKENDMSLTVNMTQSTEQPQKTMSAFASFNSSNNMSPLTAVFLKRAISKASPKTEPKKKRKVGKVITISIVHYVVIDIDSQIHCSLV